MTDKAMPEFIWATTYNGEVAEKGQNYGEWADEPDKSTLEETKYLRADLARPHQEAPDQVREALAAFNKIPVAATRETLGEWVYIYQDVIRQALTSSQEDIGWQPIETAPRDGKPIVGFWIDGKPYAATMWWDDYHEEWTHYSADYYLEPTNWMPLPAPPIKAALVDEKGGG